MTCCVVPRPIAWVSTRSRDGVLNLAPFSYFNGITASPPLISIASGRRRGQRKDTAHNASSTRELVVNIVTEKHLDAMVQTSGDYPPEVDEFEAAGITTEPSVLVKPPRVKGAPIQLECKTREILEVSPGVADLIIAEIVMFHIDDSIELDEHMRFSAAKLGPVARLGGSEYALLGELRTKARPKV